jgi:hypothetical protein
MKKFSYIIVLLALLLAPSVSFADQYVNGYYRSNGTYVNGYYRSSPDGNPYNNYSYPGNYNPYTGNTATGNSDTYLSNYYGGSSYSSYDSYSPSSYSYYSTPTCPINSYYDGTSSCKCNYGYVVQGSSCVSGITYCSTKYGYNSSYDSLTNSCKCDNGYSIDTTGQCSLINPSYTLTKTSSSKVGAVVYKKSGCDYFIVEDGGRSYNLLEWYGQSDPDEGDILYGNFHTYGFHDFYDSTLGSKTHVWVEDWLLSWSSAIEKYYDKCN